MVTILIYICAAWMAAKGVLMLLGKHVPETARAAIEDEDDKQAWCRENGIINLVWGADFAFYATGAFIPYDNAAWLKYLWIGIAVVVGIGCWVAIYKSNQKYFK